MAQAVVSDILIKTPGRLCMNPTDLTAAFPHGGTALGECRQMRALIRTGNYVVTAEEFREPIEKLYLGEVWHVSAILRSHDSDMLQKVFTNGGVPSQQSAVRVTSPSTNRAGYRLSQKSLVLYFSPNDSARHPALLLYKALPLVEETLELNFGLANNLEYACLFTGIRDSQDRVAVYGLKETFSL